MHAWVFRLSVLAACLTAVGKGSAATWLTDYKTAVETAKTQGKMVMMDFTGSDWCGWCMKLKAEVFDTPEFAAFADANLVLLEVDFPRRKVLSAQQRTQNASLQQKYKINGFPTLILAKPDGQPLAELGYMPGGPKPFIGQLIAVPGNAWKDTRTADAAEPDNPPVAPKDEPLWGGIVTPQKQYTDLKLTGLSGPATRRLALINNQTFAAGEAARVKLNAAQVKVLCKEIRANSVVIQVEGSPDTRELFLGK